MAVVEVSVGTQELVAEVPEREIGSNLFLK
jgi:hypothetical protein